jgi:phosphatidyl-myo-inositol dimannoside synthase
VNILVLTADYPPIEGGISTVTVQTSRELAALGHDVTVVAPHFPGQEAFDAAEPVKVVRYRGYGLGWLRFLPLALAAWPRIRSADLVLGINVAYGGILGWLAARRMGKPYVTFAYAYEFLKFAHRLWVARLFRAVYARAAAVIAISRFTRDSLLTFGADGANVVTVLPGATPANPPSAEAVASAKDRFLVDTDHMILGVGRFVPRKGQLTLVRALPAILARFPDAQLILVGRGPSLYEVDQEAITLGVRDHVLFPGCVSDEEVNALYALCEVFALPTGTGAGGQVEGFGLVFAEAQAHGKPVVAGRSGGVPDAVLDGETGLLVEPDDPDAAAAAIVRLMADPELARMLGENGRDRVKRELNWACFTQHMLDAAGDGP